MSARSIVRNPYVWGFVIGIVTLTAIRPLLRHVPAPPPVIGQVPAYTLVDDAGKPYGSQDLQGQVYVVSFFFTSCRSICPAIMRGMARLQDGLDQRGVEGVRLVSITVDPEHDTPETLRAYAGELGVKATRWTLLTGDPASIKRVVVDGFKTPMDPAQRTPSEPMDIAHTGKVVLVDGQGRIRGYYDTDEMGLDEVFNRAQHVLRESK